MDIDVYIFLHVSVWNEDLSAGNLFGSWFKKVGIRKWEMRQNEEKANI